MNQDVRVAFDLGRKTLSRFAVIKTQPSTCYFIWTHHHILLDGWSAALVVNEINDLYAKMSVTNVRQDFFLRVTNTNGDTGESANFDSTLEL